MKRSILFVLFFLVVFTGPAGAQLFLEEGKVALSVSGGERINKSLIVDNMSKDEMDVRVYWEDFSYQPPFDGSKQFFPAGTVSGSAGGWVQYMPQEFKILPSSKQRIDYTVNVPPDIEGGHYGVLFFERTAGPAASATGVKIVTRVGCLFFIEAKNKLKKAGIADVILSGNDLGGNLVNSGNVVIIPRMTYYIMDDTGMVADRGEVAKLYVPPGASAPWKISLPKELAPGHYSLMVNADLDEGDIAVKEITLQKSAAGDILVEKVQD